MKKLLFTLFLTGMSVLSFAQFKIHSDGKISINTTETPIGDSPEPHPHKP